MGACNPEALFGRNGVTPKNTIGYPPPKKLDISPNASRVISEALQRVDFALHACAGPKLPLWRTSEMAFVGVPFSLLLKGVKRSPPLNLGYP